MTVNVNGPDAVGVPARTPPVDNVSPAGNAPDEMLYAYGAVPPDATIVWVAYGLFCRPSGTEAGLTVIVGTIVIVIV